MAQIVYTGVSGTADITGTLFQGCKFWLSHRVPTRTTFIEQITSNGGEVVPLEINADIKIVDHARKDNAPGTYSWQYIERSVRNGVLENLEDHRVGEPQGTVRTVGSATIPKKGTRTPFTAEDDRVLFEWVTSFEAQGGAILGNKIYEQLAAQNPRHTLQSWRDRWVKQLQYRPRPAQVPRNGPPTPPTDQPQAPTTSVLPAVQSCPSSKAFDEDDIQALLAQAAGIENLDAARTHEAWQTWASIYTQHSADEWQTFWRNTIRPRWQREQAKTIFGSNVTKKVPSRDTVADGGELQEDKAAANNTIGETSPHKNSSHYVELPEFRERTSAEPQQTESNIEPAIQNYQMIPLEDSAEDTIDPESDKDLVVVTTSSKRKREVSEELPSCLPPRVSGPSSKKRLRSKQPEFQRFEIPSTPERRITVSSKFRRTPPEDVIDFEAGGSTVEHADDSEKDDAEGIYTGDGEGWQEAREHLTETSRSHSNNGSKFETAPEDLGLDIPAPEGGWDTLDGEDSEEEDRSDDEEEDDQISTPKTSTVRRKAADTQALFQAQTLPSDLDVPEPPQGWDTMDEPASSPPMLPRKPQPVILDQAVVNTIFDRWLDRHVGEGVPMESLETALKCANLDPDLADKALESLLRNGTIPDGVRGLWTAKDDACLVAVDARDIDRVTRKHGQEAFDKRYEFLRNYEAD